MIPNHVAIILDGNGRWAKGKGKPRTYGHKVGAENVEKITRIASNLGIKYLTLYAFSTENWSRPNAEVSTLMVLFEKYIKKCIKDGKENNMRIWFIGDRSGFSQSLRESMERAERETACYDGFNLILALNYGGRDEMVRAMKKMYKDIEDGKIAEDEITEDLYSSYLDTAGIPYPDLLIRTSGEQRLSNFLLWQLAYSEFYFTNVPWPEFDENELRKALEAFEKRDRRFGGLKEE
ncbi:MAG: isoprenyl transferase [Lachnospiraceae bacterium]|nr:isoprenyl transferase [Lachnospiraceae bacterium]